MHIRQLILIGFLLHGFAQAQSLTPEVMATSGDFFSTTAGSLSWTLGEPVVETFSNVTSTLTQGFQQSEINLNGIEELNTDICVSVYPNPTSGKIYVQFTNPQHAYTSLNLYALNGTLLKTVDVFNNQEFYTDISAFPNGTYIMTITDKNQLHQSITILKR
jgi:hypothetical protein